MESVEDPTYLRPMAPIARNPVRSGKKAIPNADYVGGKILDHYRNSQEDRNRWQIC